VTNLFEEAIERRQLSQFALGTGRYHVDDRSGMGFGEHWVLGSWYAILDLHSKDPDGCAAGVRSMFSSLVGRSTETTARNVWPIVEHLTSYWIRRDADLIAFDLGPITAKVTDAVAAERERCRRGSSEADLEMIDLAVAQLQRLGGLSDLD